jgi:glycosyltransferase involved in cell wall biosynthesis
MRIAYILNTLETGGAERLVLSLAGQMHSRGHAVRVLVLRDRRARPLRTDLDLVYLRMRRDPISALAGFARAIRAMREFRPEVVHGNQFHGNMLARMLHLANRRVPVISTIHNVHEGGRLRMLAYRLTDRLSARNIAVCSAAAQRFAAIRACSPEKLRVIANGIDLAAFTPDTARRGRVRAEMEAGDKFVWLAVCRLAPAKDLANLLRAFATVRKGEPRAQLWIAGDGTDSYVVELKRLNRELGNGPAVRWLGMRDDVAALLDAADAFVLSSAWEGMPLALAEAMAMEKAFVASDVGGVRELAGDCGVLVPGGDAEALAEAMLTVMSVSDQQRRDAGRLARARIEQHFNLNAKSLEWERCYAQVIAGA